MRIDGLCRPENSFSAAHSLAEVYSNLTSMPPPNRVHPAQAELVVENLLSKLTFVSLASAEFFKTARSLSQLGLTGSIIYDGLIPACARKAKAERIYTWNAQRFKLVAPDLADRIVTP